MDGDDSIPTFNLKAVIRETGLKPDTLRAWERRYGLPEPNRSSGGHRLYSQRDIRVLKWLIARQNEGMSISRAVELWRRHEADGKDPLQMPEYATPDGARAPLAFAGGESLAELREAWIGACLSFDEPKAEHVLAQAFAVYPPEVVCFEVLQRGLSTIGDGWYQDEITVQQEHFASGLAIRRLETLIAATPAPTRPGRILIGSPPDEGHIFSPLLLTLLLRRLGYDVVYLGANVPAQRLEHTVTTARPNFVVMPVQQLHTAASLLDVIEALRPMSVPVAFGGLVFNRIPELAERIPGYFLGQRIDRAVQSIEQLLQSPLRVPAAPPLPPGYHEALTGYLKAQIKIEARTWDLMLQSGISPDNLAVANLNIGRNIIAALRLGNVNFLGPDIYWMRELLTNFGVPAHLTGVYLRAYHDAAAAYLGHQGDLLVRWLDEAASMGAGT